MMANQPNLKIKLIPNKYKQLGVFYYIIGKDKYVESFYLAFHVDLQPTAI